MYAAFKHRRKYLDAVKGDHVATAIPFSSRFMDHGRRDVDAFTMHHSVAWLQAQNEAESPMTRAAERLMREKFDADECEITQLTVDFLERRTRPVYLPAFVIEYRANWNPSVAFVGGVTGAVGGEFQWSAAKTGAATFAAANVLYFAVPYSLAYFNPSLWLLAVLAPTVGVGVFARWAPSIEAGRQERRRLRERASSAHVHPDYFKSQSWTAGEEQYSVYYQQQQREFQKSRSSFWTRAKREGLANADPKEYYKVLGLEGLERSSTVQDVQAAFRRQAMLWHPDHADKDDVDEATARFRRVLAAYSVLRNPELRKQYDQTGE